MIFCQACGHQMHREAIACPSCGKPNALNEAVHATSSPWTSMRGRIGRKVYWLHYVLPLTMLGVLLGAIMEAAHMPPAAITIVSWILIIPNVAGSVKRLHDRDHSAWMLLLGLIPVIGWIWLFVVTGFLPGTPGRNRYGSDPLATASFLAGRPLPQA